MLQELVTVGEETGCTKPGPVSIPRTGQRTLKEPEKMELPECYVGKRKSPGYDLANKSLEGGKDAYDDLVMRNMLWMLIRLYAAKTQQRIPAWRGYVSLTEEVPSRLTTVDCYTIIPHTITENKAVQECLRYSEEASREVGQRYVVTTFDLGVCMKA